MGNLSGDLLHHLKIALDLARNRPGAAEDVRTGTDSLLRSVRVLLTGIAGICLIDLWRTGESWSHLPLDMISVTIAVALGYGFVWAISDQLGAQNRFPHYFVIGNWLIVVNLGATLLITGLEAAVAGAGPNDPAAAVVNLFVLGFLVVYFIAFLRITRHVLEIGWIAAAALMATEIIINLGVTNLFDMI